ncbi:Na+/H+ antiporter NhaA [Nissabacter sp. SGAir0207]|uniref:Na+/H+ antiporter NhaA n=1 Tax=Nissabacter sp. SGAir0207 TaxID=2126321 RepID=UPI0010CCCA8B|nr:Na+/H+ antiporter NhaA [Nissabacter sp. SGAir0207]QCR37219.1 Na+/H+ antiporter NhaA [Nissabacter sp. SGAir0207]
MHNIIRQFFNMEASGGIVLIVAAAAALVMANSSLEPVYHALVEFSLPLQAGGFDFTRSAEWWINDGLMAIFFLLVGMEVKRELLEGSLAGINKALFPVIAALGGMIAPSLIYLLFNAGDEITRVGWAIPAATDIAFAVGVMALLGSRVPVSLKAFLLALAIIDDLGAIVIIALFYTADLSLIALAAAGGVIAVMALLNWRGVNARSIYLLLGVVLWVCILQSGIHATLAGVITGFLIPLNRGQKVSPLRQLEHQLHPWVSRVILPLFAFANAGIVFGSVTLAGLFTDLPLGIIAGLFIGKPVGITLICWLAVKMRIASLPDDITFKHISAVSVLCGIGFTMSIFIAGLAFGHDDPHLMTYAKIGILSGSLLAAFFGYLVLSRVLPAKRPA